MSRTTPPLPPAVIAAIDNFAKDIKRARRRRLWSTVDLSYCLQISRSTLAKVECGDPAVSLGIYALVLHRLKLLDRLSAAADGLYDKFGRSYADAMVPQRIHGLRGRRRRGGFASPARTDSVEDERRFAGLLASSIADPVATTAQADGEDHSP